MAINPHIDDKDFNDKDVGLPVPQRRRNIGQASLRISNLDDADPPSYANGQYPRTQDFNDNVLYITNKPKMPSIRVDCELVGVDPTTTPILWRLQTRYVVGRYQKVSGGDDPHYRSRVLPLEDTWTGTAHSATFTLFPDNEDPNVAYDNGPPFDRVAGGQAILTVAVEAPGGAGWLQDYVHLRIGGKNPSVQSVNLYVANILGGRDPNIVHMANAVFVHENSMQQFDPDYRTQTHYKGVLFDWPHDPENFPSVAFDFGIGIGQFTHPGEETGPICWDWRENVKSGVNELLDDLKDTFPHTPTWIAWARRAWSEYNTGSPNNDHGQYANALAILPDGQAISTSQIPHGYNVNAATAKLPMQGAPPAPRDWPVPALVG
jgi:hypothetical protein